MDLVLGIDLGTSYFKAGLFDRTGMLYGLGRVGVLKDQKDQKDAKDRRDGGRCELPVGRFWERLRDAVGQAMEEAGAEPRDVKALSYSSQANSFVLLDGDEQPLTPLILWPDLRVTEVDARLEALWEREDYLATTGMNLRSPQFAAAKLRWLQKHERESWTRTRRVQTISDYFTSCLTGQYVGDEGTASLLGLWDLQKRAWWPVGLEAVDLRQEQLSRPLPPGTVAGNVTNEGGALLGIPAGIPFAVGSLDHHAAAIGAGLGVVATAAESTGTVLCALRGAGSYVPHADYCVGPGTEEVGGNHRFYEFAFDENGASAIEWYQRTQAPDMTIAELLELARDVPPGADGLTMQPCRDGTLSMTRFVGAAQEHGHGHYVRAILESVSASLGELLGRLFPDGPPEAVCATGGGAQSGLWLQIKADMLGVPFIRTACAEPACLGTAMFAGVACGWFASLQEAGEAMVSRAKRFGPGRIG